MFIALDNCAVVKVRVIHVPMCVRSSRCGKIVREKGHGIEEYPYRSAVSINAMNPLRCRAVYVVHEEVKTMF